REAVLLGPEVREEVRAAVRLQDPPQGRRLLEPDGLADADRRRWRRRTVGPGVSVWRRQPALDQRRRRQAGERRPDPELERLHPDLQVTGAQHGRREAL